MGKPKRSPSKEIKTGSVNLHSVANIADLSKPHRFRKEKRKEKRQLKKLRRLAFSQKKPIPTQEDLDKAKEKVIAVANKKEKLRLTNIKKRAKKKKKKYEAKKEAAMKKEQSSQMLQREDRELHHLEKQLKLKKSVNTLPRAFINDGLDYLLDAVDEEKLKLAREQNFKETMLDSDDEDMPLGDLDSEEDDSGDEFDVGGSDDDEVDSDVEMDAETQKNTKMNALTKFDEPSLKTEQEIKTEKKKVNFSPEEESDVDENYDDDKNSGDDDDEKSGNDDDENNGDDDENSGDDKKKNQDATSRTEVKEGMSEDIYGRLRDEKGNFIVDSKVSNVYIPPAKRRQLTQDTGKRKLVLERLKKQMKGLINRTSESNIQSISLQIEDIYRSKSRADVSETLTGLVMEACASNSLTPERLTLELVMLVTLLHANVGNEVGAYFIQTLAEKFSELCRQPGYGGEKRVDNIVLLFTGLYNFKVIRSTLIFDILKRFVDCFKEKDIELILLILKSAGFTLRKDDPAALKAAIVEIQSKASTVDVTTFVDQSRVKFMLEVILAIRNNNMRKIPNFDPDHLEHLKKLTRNYIRGSGFGDNQLEITLDDLLQAEEKGRWWLVGSAWDGRMSDSKSSETSSKITSGALSKASTKLLDLARKMRMNTDIRKNIFCVIMTSEDFLDGFEKLLRLGLKQKQEREIIHVMQDCCLQEKKFNPFYAVLTQKFCEHDHRFQITFQFSLWDKFKEMGNLSEQNRENLAKLVSYLVINKGISLSVLKVVEFGTLGKPMVRFLKHLLQDMLLNHSVDSVEAAFLRIASVEKLRHLQEGLKLFMQHFLLRQKSREDNSQNMELKEKVKLAERALSAGQSRLLL